MEGTGQSENREKSKTATAAAFFRSPSVFIMYRNGRHYNNIIHTRVYDTKRVDCARRQRSEKHSTLTLVEL